MAIKELIIQLQVFNLDHGDSILSWLYKGVGNAIVTEFEIYKMDYIPILIINIEPSIENGVYQYDRWS